MKLSKKYSFSLLSILFALLTPILVQALGLHFWLSLSAMVGCHLVILVVCVTYLTGQAKIDLELEAIYGRSSHKDLGQDSKQPFG